MTISVIPERVIMTALVEGLQYIRSNPKLMAVLFQNFNDNEFDRAVNFISKTQVNFKHNYPRAELTPPCVVLLLKNESEETQFMGDMMGVSPLYGLPPQEHMYDTALGHAASTSSVKGLGKKLAGNLSVITESGGKVWVVNNPYATLSNYSDAIFLHVISGAGKGQVFEITRVDEEYLDIGQAFTVPLDNTSKVDVREGAPALEVGEPVRIYAEDDTVSRRGAYYGATYVLDIIAGSMEEIQILYAIIRAILFLFKASLEAQGIQNLILSGSDFAPRTEFVPDHLFHRSMNMQFSYPFSVIVEEDVIKALELCMHGPSGMHLNLGGLVLNGEEDV